MVDRRFIGTLTVLPVSYANGLTVYGNMSLGSFYGGAVEFSPCPVPSWVILPLCGLMYSNHGTIYRPSDKPELLWIKEDSSWLVFD